MVAALTSSEFNPLAAPANSLPKDTGNSEANTLKGQAKLLRETVSFAFRGKLTKGLLETQKRIDALKQQLAELRERLGELEASNVGIAKQVEEAKRENLDKIFGAKRERYLTLVKVAKDLVREGRDSSQLLANLERVRRSVLALKEANNNYLTLKANQERLLDLEKIRRLGLTTAELYNYRLAKEITLYLFGFKWL